MELDLQSLSYRKLFQEQRYPTWVKQCVEEVNIASVQTVNVV